MKADSIGAVEVVPILSKLSTSQRVKWFLIKALLTLLISTPILAEGILRLSNRIYPLERPASLRDDYRMQLLEGTWSDGATRFFTYKPNTEGKTYGHPFRVNRWGVRGPDFAERAQMGPQPYRIMVLGDSVTSGIGIAEEDRYTNLLERRLRERYSSRPIEVINLAVQGFETVQEVKMLQRMGAVVGPNLIIVGVYINDTNITYDYYLPYKIPLPASLEPLSECLLTYRISKGHYDKMYRALHHIPQFEEVQKRSLNHASRDWQSFTRSVEDMGMYAKTHTQQQPIAIYLFGPVQASLELGYEQVRETYLKHGFMWANDRLAVGYEPVSQFEGHPNKRSHEQYADALFATIIAHLPTDL